MKIRVLGAGWYGAHIGLALREKGHDVEVHESADHVFAGASGSNPARLHEGFHYPRSRLTRAFCQDHKARFLKAYGHLTRAVPINIYAIAAKDSLIDFGTYTQVLKSEVDLVSIHDPREFGLQNVEGAVLTGERHIIIRLAREYFTAALGPVLKLNTPAGSSEDTVWDWTIDCTFCALDRVDVDRYEPCITGILGGPVNTAVTIMDGPFPSLYPWDEMYGLNSLTSAKYTPLDRCSSWLDAKKVLEATTQAQARGRVQEMFDQLVLFWPDVAKLYSIVDWKFGIRAMPRSAAAARTVDVVRIGDRLIRIRAGKIDAVFQAQLLVEEIIDSDKDRIS